MTEAVPDVVLYQFHDISLHKDNEKKFARGIGWSNHCP